MSHGIVLLSTPAHTFPSSNIHVQTSRSKFGLDFESLHILWIIIITIPSPSSPPYILPSTSSPCIPSPSSPPPSPTLPYHHPYHHHTVTMNDHFEPYSLLIAGLFLEHGSRNSKHGRGGFLAISANVYELTVHILHGSTSTRVSRLNGHIGRLVKWFTNGTNGKTFPWGRAATMFPSDKSPSGPRSPALLCTIRISK